MDESRFLAFDLGAESGRAVVGTLEGGRLLLDEIHRFQNEPVELCGTLHWDILSLYNNVLKGMRTYSRCFGESLDGIGIDTWGLDFALLAADGSLLQNPVCYRDRRTEGMPEQVRRRMSSEELFQGTGLPLFPIYTLCQLLSLRLRESPILESAATFLMIPDLLGYFLTGQKRCERTNAISTQLYDPHKGQWADQLFRTFELPRHIMPDIVDPGTILGELCEPVIANTGLKRTPLIAPCTHDTASAVAAVPGKGDDWAFISSGTWSVLGALTEGIVTSKGAFSAGVLNELTLQSFFLCWNIMGLWLLQQARAAWQRQGESYSYADLVKLAEGAPEGGPLIHPDDASFLAPEDMCKAIRDYCKRTDQPQPQGPGETTRCILESLALSYRHALDRLKRILGRDFRVLHIVGGGALNTLLCQLTADATGMPVVAGPAEATVAGNVLVQALAHAHLRSPQEIRDVVRESSRLVEYEPQEPSYWEDRCETYRQILKQSADQ